MESDKSDKPGKYDKPYASVAQWPEHQTFNLLWSWVRILPGAPID